jgi:hypothetical protein
VTAGTRRLRNPPSAVTEAAASAATLAYNVAISQVTSGIGDLFDHAASIGPPGSGRREPT